MYDTIRGYIITEDDLTKYFEKASTYINKRTGEIRDKGNYKNLQFFENADGYSFSGSLTNCVLGHNFSGITHQQTNDLIQDISTSLNLDFTEARLTRIDFGNCLEVEDIPESYFQILGYLNNHLQKTQINSTLYYGFKNNYRSLIFYDKLKDYKKRKLAIPENKLRKNNLRYELKYKRTSRLKRLAKKERITVKDITESKVFNLLLDDWLNLYKSIQKEPKESITMNNQQLGLTGLNNLLLKYHISSLGGLSGFREWIEIETKKGNFKKGTYKKAILDKAKVVCNIEAEIDKDSKIQELDSKIKEISNNYRC
jgi:hypothetical protein